MIMQGFTAESELHKKLKIPLEDRFSFKSKSNFFILAVADGVTRDPEEILPERKEDFAKNYPRPSPAAEVSQIFCEEFEKINEFSKKAVEEIFRKANEKIMKYNKNKFSEINYTTKDFAGCVAAGAIASNKEIIYGYICDCGIALFDKNGKLKFRTKDEGPSQKDKEIWPNIYKKFGNDASWRYPEVRREIRKNYRNVSENPSFGVLTGQMEALTYVKTGKISMREGDVLIAFTDGAEEFVFSRDFSKMLKNKNLEGMEGFFLKRIRTEGTIVLGRS